MTETIYIDGEYRIDREGDTIVVELSGRRNPIHISGYEVLTAPLPAVARQLGPKASQVFWLRGQAANALVRSAAGEAVQAVIDEVASARDAKANAERQALLEVLPGLDELEAAYEARDRNAAEFNRMMEDEQNDGVCPPKTKVPDIAALQEKYPAATAYLRFQELAYSSHWASGRGSICERAAERIAAGEDHEVVTAEAEAEWSGVASAAVARA